MNPKPNKLKLRKISFNKNAKEQAANILIGGYPSSWSICVMTFGEDYCRAFENQKE